MTTRRFLFYFLISLGLFSGLTSGAFAQVRNNANPEPALYVPGEILIQWKEGSATEGENRLGPRLGAFQRLRHQNQISHGKLHSSLTVEEGVRQAFQDPAVKWAQPNYLYHAHACAAPTSLTDPYYTSVTLVQGCGTNLINSNWPFTQINAPQAWAALPFSCPASAAITVAILDTGVASTSSLSRHPDLPASLFVPGTNVITGSPDSTDDYGHGTWVAGIIAAQWANGGGANACTSGTVPAGNFNGGMAGVAGYPGLVRILPVKVLDNTGSGTSQNIIDGTNFAVSHGAKVLNFSLGATASDPLEQQAIEAAISAGCVVVASAGNESTTRRKRPLDYPAAYPGVLSVGALTVNQTIAFYSNGGTGLSLVAPGGAASASFDAAHDIFASMLNCPSPGTAGANGFNIDPCDSNYGSAAGTSASAPFVTGAAALVWAVNPSLFNTDVSNILIQTATDLGTAGWDSTFGNGLLNLGVAVAAAVTFTPVPPTPTTTFTPGATFTFTRTPTKTSTATATKTATASFTSTVLLTSTLTSSPTASATRTATPTATASPTATATNTTTATPTSTATATSTHTSTNSPTSNSTATATSTPTSTVTNTTTLTATSTPTASATSSATSTATASPTLTSTHTSTNTFTASPTATATSTPTSTATNTTTSTATSTSTASATSSATFTATSTATMTSTHTSTYTPTASPTATATSTPTSTATNTATSTSTSTPTSSATSSATSTATASPTSTSTHTSTNTASATASQTPTHSPTNTGTASATPTPTSTPTSSPTATTTSSTTSTTTNTFSSTPTSTTSETPTTTSTNSDTFTPTSTSTNSTTPTPSSTPTASPTTTATNTATLTTTSTPTASATSSTTSTATNTFSSTPTSTTSETPTTTSTNSDTFTPTSTPTASATSSTTSTATASTTVSSTASPSPTATDSATPSPTNPVEISTPTPSPSPVMAGNFYLSDPYPNPSFGSPVQWDAQAIGTWNVDWSVFTAGGKKIRQENLTVTGNSVIVWDMKDKTGSPVANGIYFVRFRAHSGTLTYSHTFKVIIAN